MHRSSSIAVAVAVAVAVVTGARAAHAGQTQYTSTVVAWNRDGSSVLVEERGSHEPDQSSTTYKLAGDGDVITVAVTDTLGTSVEAVSVAACATAAKQLATELTARHFVGVSVAAGHCKTAGRALLAVTAGAADPGWVRLPKARKPTTLERSALELANRAVDNYDPFVPSTACTGTYKNVASVDVATRGGALVLVLENEGPPCSGLLSTAVHRFVRTADGYRDDGVL